MNLIDILDMSLHKLKAFALVAELGSFKDAAEALELSPPCVTMLVKDLEKTYKLILFNRVRHRTVLTSQGEIFLGQAKRVLAEVEVLDEEAD